LRSGGGVSNTEARRNENVRGASPARPKAEVCCGRQNLHAVYVISTPTQRGSLPSSRSVNASARPARARASWLCRSSPSRAGSCRGSLRMPRTSGSAPVTQLAEYLRIARQSAIRASTPLRSRSYNQSAIAACMWRWYGTRSRHYSTNLRSATSERADRPNGR
jgi:hypothetical protein